MADIDPSVPAGNALQLHPKIFASTAAGALVHVILGFSKAKWGIDLAGYEPDLIILMSFAAGYITPGA